MVMRRGHFALSSDARWTQIIDGPEPWKMPQGSGGQVRERADIRSVNLPISEELPPTLRRQTQMFIRGNG